MIICYKLLLFCIAGRLSTASTSKQNGRYKRAYALMLWRNIKKSLLYLVLRDKINATFKYELKSPQQLPTVRTCDLTIHTVSGFCHYRIRPLQWLRILTIILTYRRRVNSFTQKTIKDYKSVSTSSFRQRIRFLRLLSRCRTLS